MLIVHGQMKQESLSVRKFHTLHVGYDGSGDSCWDNHEQQWTQYKKFQIDHP